MARNIAALIFAFICFQASMAAADDGASQLTGTWKLVSWQTKFDGGDAVEPYGPAPKGRVVITSDGYWLAILTGAHRASAKITEEKAALFDSMLAYSGKYSIQEDRITVRVDMSSNEIYTGQNQNQMRYFKVDGDTLIIRTPEIASAVRVGQKAVGTLTFQREH
jgi:hypothetical protein